MQVEMLNRSINIISLFWDLAVSWVLNMLGLSRAKRFKLGEEIGTQLGEVKSILLFGYMGMGDAVMFEPTLTSIIKRFPNSDFDLIVGSGSQSRAILENILSEQNRSFRSVINADFKSLTRKERLDLNRALRRKSYDMCIAVYTTPLQYFVKAIDSIPIRVGHLIRAQSWYKPRPNYLFNLGRKVDQEIDEREPFRHFRLAQAIGIQSPDLPIPRIVISKNGLEWAHTFLLQNNLQDAELIGVHLGVSRAMAWKKWSDDKYAEVFSQLAQPNRHFLFFGSADELQEIERASKGVKDQATVFAGTLEIMEVGAILKHCSLLIGNDSGIGHLSVALDIPTFRIFGPSDKYGCEPMTAGHTILAKNLTCSPCMNLGLIKPGYNVLNCGHRNCLQLIAVPEVLGSIQELIENPRAK